MAQFGPYSLYQIEILFQHNYIQFNSIQLESSRLLTLSYFLFRALFFCNYDVIPIEIPNRHIRCLIKNTHCRHHRHNNHNLNKKEKKKQQQEIVRVHAIHLSACYLILSNRCCL